MKTLPLGLLFAICAFGQKVDVEFDEAADFTKYKTFTIRDGQLHSKNPTLNSELVKKRVVVSIGPKHFGAQSYFCGCPLWHVRKWRDGQSL